MGKGAGCPQGRDSVDGVVRCEHEEGQEVARRGPKALRWARGPEGRGSGWEGLARWVVAQ